MNFELILTSLVFVSGLLVLLERFYLAPKRVANGKQPILIEYACSFFPVLLLVLIIRSFIIEPFRIPSGSLKPSLLVGDFVLTNKFTYGIRLPVLGTKIININEPKRGDIVVFRWPPDPSIDYIKRVVGLPGDHISYINKTLYINGKEAPQQLQAQTIDKSDNGTTWAVEQKQEDLLGVKHAIFIHPGVINEDINDIVVPPNHYFMMGDNRDDSYDSRGWGFVPDANLVGKAILVWFSWDSDNNSVRWKRLGLRINSNS